MAVSAYSDASRNSSFSQINVTPLVDVMLVLLIIFMVTMPLMTQRLELTLPRPDADSGRTPPPRHRLLVQADGTLVLGGTPLTPAELGTHLASLSRHSPGMILELETQADADYQAFAAALSTARSSGVANIAMVQ